MPEKYLPNMAFQPYIAPQQERPVEEFNNLGTVLNQRYDQNMAKWDELDAYMNQVQLNDADKSIKDSVMKDTRDVIKNIRENGNWENGKLQVREVAKRLANDQALAIGQQNFKKAQEQKDTEAKMRMQGINLIDFNQNRFNQQTVDPLTGRARTLDYSGTEKLQDYDARRKSLFEGIQADGYDSESSSPVFNKSNGMIYQVGSGSSARYVSAKKVKDIASRNLNNYLESAEGQQELKVLTTQNSMNGQPLSIIDAKKQILNGIVNTGMTRAFNQTGSKNTTSITSLGSYGQAKTDALPQGQMAESLPIDQSRVNPVYKDLADKLTLKRRLTSATASDIGEHPALGQVTGGMAGGIPRLSSKATYGDFTKKESEAMNNIGSMLGIKKQPSGQYSVKDIAKIQQYVSQKQETASAPTYRAFTEKEISENNNYVANGNLRSRGFFDLEKGEFTDYKNLPSSVREALDGKKPGEVQFSGVVNADNHFYDLAKNSKRETDSDGWLRPQYITVAGKRFAVTSPASETRKSDIGFVKAVNQLTSANRYGVPVRLQGPDGHEFVTSPSGQISKDGQPIYTIKDLNGNTVKELPVNDLAQTVLQGMKIKD